MRRALARWLRRTADRLDPVEGMVFIGTTDIVPGLFYDASNTSITGQPGAAMRLTWKSDGTFRLGDDHQEEG